MTFYRFFNVKNAFLWCIAIFPIQSISRKYLGGSPPPKFGRGRAAHFFNPYPISDQSYDFPYPTSQVMIIINKRPTDEILWLLQRALRPGAVHVSSKILVFVWNQFRKLKMTINSRSNIVLVLFLYHLKAFQPHFRQFLGFWNSSPPISTLNKRLCIKSKQNIKMPIPFVFPVFPC